MLTVRLESAHTLLDKDGQLENTSVPQATTSVAAGLNTGPSR